MNEDLGEQRQELLGKIRTKNSSLQKKIETSVMTVQKQAENKKKVEIEKLAGKNYQVTDRK